ncbi:putative DNA ligase [Acinetobacter phage SH-Ab 15599]|nr:putative DNA ligase [Acinetobacter phage SH-Ab 15599]
MNVHEIIQATKAAKGSNNKIGLLNNNSNNKLLENFLATTYDTRVSFYVNKFTMGEPSVQAYDDIEVENMLDFVQSLSERLLTGNAALEAITEFTGQLSAEGQSLFNMLIKRDIKAGVAAGTLIKVWPKSIFIEPYQRCCLAKDTKTDLRNWGMYISQLKADGMFSSASCSTEIGHIASRAGTIYPKSAAFDLVNSELQSHAHLEAFPGVLVGDCTVEGELIVVKDGKELLRAESNGMLNSLQQSGEALPEGYDLVYHVWDILPTARRTYKGTFNVAYKQRFDVIERLFGQAGVRVKPIETKFFNTYAECVAHFLETIGLGKEGTIIKHPSATWMDGDNPLQIKMKIEAECELRVKGFNPAEEASKYEHQFGSLQCESEDGLLAVGVSSGLTDAMRTELHAMGDSLIECVITVKFNDVMLPKEDQNKHSLFLPRFVELRLDKSSADSLPRIFDIFEDAKKNAS